MNSGVAPTDLNARTGLSTPPGSSRDAAANSRSDCLYRPRFSIIASLPSAFCLLPSAFFLLPSAFCLPPSVFRLLSSPRLHLEPAPLDGVHARERRQRRARIGRARDHERALDVVGREDVGELRPE